MEWNESGCSTCKRSTDYCCSLWQPSTDYWLQIAVELRFILTLLIVVLDLKHCSCFWEHYFPQNPLSNMVQPYTAAAQASGRDLSQYVNIRYKFSTNHSYRSDNSELKIRRRRDSTTADLVEGAWGEVAVAMARKIALRKLARRRVVVAPFPVEV